MTNKTNIQYLHLADEVKEVFISKNKDYGTSWRILRVTTLLDQIFIKASRIRSIEEQKSQQIEDDVRSEYIGIINYCILTLIQNGLNDKKAEIKFEEICRLYDYHLEEAKKLMQNKNHDYGEAWRGMYISSFTDIILARILRIRQIIENEGRTLVSEGIDANLYDMINYAFFALIKLDELHENN